MNKTTRRLRHFGLIVVSIAIAACGSDYEYPAPGELAPPPAPAAGVELKVLAADGPPVADVTVTVQNEAGEAMNAEGSSGSDGVVILDDLPTEAAITLRLLAEGYATQVRRVETGTAGSLLRVEALLAIGDLQRLHFVE